MKRVLSVIILLAVLIFAGQEKVFAYDVYCGTFSDGVDAYLLTETVEQNRYQESSYGIWITDIYCTVKYLKNGSVTYVDYKFSCSEVGVPHYTNSQGNSGRIIAAPTNTINRIYKKAQNYV